MAHIKEANTLGIGILGCGPIAQFAHFESVQKGRNTHLAAVCDRDEGLARHFGTFYDAAKIHTDYDAMLADEAVKAVIIATSDAFHVPAARKALAAGKHVFCEKPIGLAVEEVSELAADVKRSGLKLQIGHMLRFDPGIEAAHDFVTKEMGELLALKAWYCDSTHRYTMTDAVQPLPRLGANALKPAGNPKADLQRYNMLAHGSHLVDLTRWLGGPISAVETRFAARFGAMSFFVDVEFENGGLGHLDLSIPIRGPWHEGFQLYGEHGSAFAKIFNPWYYMASEVDIFRESTGASTRALGADGHFYRRQIEGFADVLLKGAAMKGADIEDGLAGTRAMVAIMQSLRQKKPVALKDASGPV
jgi:predicted dehydrogenase